MKRIREIFDRNFEIIMYGLLLVGAWSGLGIICAVLLYVFGVL